MLALSNPELLSGDAAAPRGAALPAPTMTISIHAAPDFSGRTPSSERE
jgi:hypothetical protein